MIYRIHNTLGDNIIITHRRTRKQQQIKYCFLNRFIIITIDNRYLPISYHTPSLLN